MKPEKEWYMNLVHFRCLITFMDIQIKSGTVTVPSLGLVFFEFMSLNGH